MSRVAIIAAMPGELKPLVRGWLHERRNGVELWRWRFDEGEWVAACAGAGVDAASRAFAETEKDGPVSLVISTGWAGALSEEFKPGQAYWLSGVVDARTGERFVFAGDASEREALKGHCFSRAVETPNRDAALAADGILGSGEIFPKGLKPGTSNLPAIGRAQAVPFQSDSWLVTSPMVANQAEKQRLAAAYGAALVDMEAAAVARLARMRGIPFCCNKGVSDGCGEKLPDFNNFIAPDGRFRIVKFVLFAVFRPWYWPVLVRMGGNGKKAAQQIAESLLDFLDERETIRKRNGYPNLKI
jgi:adenosylhomocysteine nucleosidase